MRLPVPTKKTSSAAFTLIELLIVIAVIGVLAAVLLAVINPLEQLARGRDGGRISTVNQLGNSLQRYFTTNNTYPMGGVPSTAWLSTLVTSGEVQSPPSNPTGPGYTSACGTGDFAATGTNNICYNANATNAVVYMLAESSSNKAKCTGATPIAWQTWSSAAGKSGIVCTANSSTGPAIGVTTFQP